MLHQKWCKNRFFPPPRRFCPRHPGNRIFVAKKERTVLPLQPSPILRKISLLQIISPILLA